MSLLRGWSIGFRAGALLLGAAIAAACGSTGDSRPGQSSGSGTGGQVTGAGGSGGHVASSTSQASSAGSGGQGGGTMVKGPPYPFVLAHGFFGFEEFAGLDFETYYFHVKDHLAAQGEIVDTPAVDPFNSSDVRGVELLNRVQDFLAATGASKVNIIGHSQGGLDARVVASLRPDLVASVVTISTPHYGSPVADVAMKLLADPNAQQILDALVQLVGGPLYDQIGNATSITKAFESFAQPGITAFNTKYPDSAGVFYASIAGRSSLHPDGGDCTGDVAVPFVQSWKSTLDPLNSLFYVFAPILSGSSNIVNDGLVRAKDAKWGEYWGCLPADHVDEVGQILGQSPGLGNGWKYLDFYTQLIGYLRAQGY
jgi:triacylglycerol lipase